MNRPDLPMEPYTASGWLLGFAGLLALSVVLAVVLATTDSAAAV